MRTQKTDAPLCRRSEFPLHHQTAGHAFALAGVALHAQVYGQGQVSGGREGDAQFADAGIAVQVRGIDVEAVGGGSRLAVEFVFLGRADVRSDVFVQDIGEAPAETQAA